MRGLSRKSWRDEGGKRKKETGRKGKGEGGDDEVEKEEKRKEERG